MSIGMCKNKQMALACLSPHNLISIDCFSEDAVIINLNVLIYCDSKWLHNLSCLIRLGPQLYYTSVASWL